MTKKTLPTLTNDADAERFVAEADLSEFDLTTLKPTAFRRRGDSVSVSLAGSVLDKAAHQATAQGLNLDQFIGQLVERSLAPRHG